MAPHWIFSLWMAGVSAAAPQAGRASVIPDGVRYRAATDAVNGAAKARLGQAIAKHQGLAGLAGDGPTAEPLMTGPFLTMQLGLQPSFDPARFKKVNYEVELIKGQEPKLQAAGVAAVEAPQRKELLLALDKQLALPESTKIRFLTAKELELIWFFIAWDLTEPIFALETGSRTLVVDLQDDGQAIRWVEDLTEPCFRMEGLDLPCFCAVVGGTGKKLAVGFETKKACLETYQSPTGKTYSVPGGMKTYQPSKPVEPKAGAATALKNVVLLTAQDDLAQRIPVADLSAYIKALQGVVESAFDPAPRGPPAELMIDATLEPGKKPAITLAMKPSLPREQMLKVQSGATGLAGPVVKGQVHFEVHFSIWATGEKLAPAKGP